MVIKTTTIFSEIFFKNNQPNTGTVVNFKWFTDSKMALLELSTLNEAVEALVGLHNVALNADDSRLRVSFSTKSI